MAISVTSFVILGVLAYGLLLGALLYFALASCGLLRWETLLLSAAEAPCVVDGRVLPGSSIETPQAVMAELVFVAVTFVLLLVLLAGFRRQKRWAWLGLMAWSGLNLAVSLARYFTEDEFPLQRLMWMVANAVLVLALNNEAVQVAFGLRTAPEARPARRLDAWDGEA
jgi:hypothetical protein